MTIYSVDHTNYDSFYYPSDISTTVAALFNQTRMIISVKWGLIIGVDRKKVLDPLYIGCCRGSVVSQCYDKHTIDKLCRMVLHDSYTN